MVVWYLKRKDLLWTSLLESMQHFLPLFWSPPALWHPFGSWRPHVFLQSFLKQRFTNRLEMLAHLFVMAMGHACFQRQAWPSAAAKSRNGSRIIIHWHSWSCWLHVRCQRIPSPTCCHFLASWFLRTSFKNLQFRRAACECSWVTSNHRVSNLRFLLAGLLRRVSFDIFFCPWIHAILCKFICFQLSRQRKVEEAFKKWDITGDGQPAKWWQFHCPKQFDCDWTHDDAT